MKRKLHNVLRMERMRRGLSLRDLELLTGISNPLLSQIETGHVKSPSFRTVVRIAKALEISIVDLARCAEHLAETTEERA